LATFYLFTWYVCLKIYFCEKCILVTNEKVRVYFARWIADSLGEWCSRFSKNGESNGFFDLFLMLFICHFCACWPSSLNIKFLIITVLYLESCLLRLLMLKVGIFGLTGLLHFRFEYKVTCNAKQLAEYLMLGLQIFWWLQVCEEGDEWSRGWPGKHERKAQVLHEVNRKILGRREINVLPCNFWERLFSRICVTVRSAASRNAKHTMIQEPRLALRTEMTRKAWFS
jgi:hypothetical protein